MNKNYKKGYQEAITILSPRLDYQRQATNPRGKCPPNEYLVVPEDGRQSFCRKYTKNHTGRNLAIAGVVGALGVGGAIALSGKGKGKNTAKTENEVVPTSRQQTKKEIETPNSSPATETVKPEEEKKVAVSPPKPEAPAKTKVSPKKEKKQPDTEIPDPSDDRQQPKKEVEKPKPSPVAETVKPKEGKKETVSPPKPEAPAKTKVSPKKKKKQPDTEIPDPWNDKTEKTNVPVNPTTNKTETVPEPPAPKTKKATTKITPDKPDSNTVNNPVVINSVRVAEAIAKNGIDGDMSAYDVVTTTPKLRVINKLGQVDSNATRENIKILGKDTKHFEEEISSIDPFSKNPKEIDEFVEKMRLESGLRMSPKRSFMQFRNWNDEKSINEATVHYKAHLNLKDLNKLNRDNIIELGRKLKESGYRGDFKINVNPEDAKSRYDLFTFHSHDPQEIEKAEKIAQEHFSDNIEYMGRGVDKNPINPKANFKKSERNWKSFNQINAKIVNKEKTVEEAFTPDELAFIDRKTTTNKTASAKKKETPPVKQNIPTSPEPKQEATKKPKQQTIINPEARKVAIEKIKQIGVTDGVPKEWEKDGKRMNPEEIEETIMQSFNRQLEGNEKLPFKISLDPIFVPPNADGKRDAKKVWSAYRGVLESLGYYLEANNYEDGMQKGHLLIRIIPNKRQIK
jgi:hypothetical protein